MANVRSARYSVLVFESPVLTAPPVPGRGPAASPRPGTGGAVRTGDSNTSTEYRAHRTFAMADHLVGSHPQATAPHRSPAGHSSTDARSNRGRVARLGRRRRASGGVAPRAHGAVRASVDDAHRQLPYWARFDRPRFDRASVDE